jgi:L-cysteine S-thiosulfotransferase
MLSQVHSLPRQSFAIAWTFALCILTGSQALASGSSERIEKGRWLAHEVAKGNCLACHQMPGDPGANSLANIGPPLLTMAQRFPDRTRLREQILDARRFNPETVMPPFGTHRILTAEEIELVLDYLYTL